MHVNDKQTEYCNFLLEHCNKLVIEDEIIALMYIFKFDLTILAIIERFKIHKFEDFVFR